MIGLGKRLLQARKLRKLSQAQLGAATGLGLQQSSISDIETGETKMIEADTLFALCNVLKVRAEWLWSGKGDMTAVEQLPKMPDELREVIAAWTGGSSEIKDVFNVLARHELSKSVKTLRK